MKHRWGELAALADQHGRFHSNFQYELVPLFQLSSVSLCAHVALGDNNQRSIVEISSGFAAQELKCIYKQKSLASLASPLTLISFTVQLKRPV